MITHLQHRNTIITLGKIVLPIIACFGINLYLHKSYYELLTISIFGILIVIFNYNKTRYNYLISILLSLILSNIVFFLSIALNFFLNYIAKGGDLEQSRDEISGILSIILSIIFLLTIAVISPLLMFICYGIIFKFKKSKFSFYIKGIAIGFLIIRGLIVGSMDDEYIYFYWQFVMLLSLQLILYKEELNRKKIVEY